LCKRTIRFAAAIDPTTRPCKPVAWKKRDGVGDDGEAGDAAADVAMRAENALRSARGSRRVDQCGLVVRVSNDDHQRFGCDVPSERERAEPVGTFATGEGTTTYAAFAPARSHSWRSRSPMTVTLWESVTANSSSGPVHHELSGTAIAPTAVTAQNVSGHSGRLRIAIATR
jgi:hypothetical protein